MKTQANIRFTEVGDVSDEAFERLRGIVLRECGVVLGPSKRPLMRCRLQPRLRALGISSYDAYADMLDRGDPDRKELAELLDRIRPTRPTSSASARRSTTSRASSWTRI